MCNAEDGALYSKKGVLERKEQYYDFLCPLKTRFSMDKAIYLHYNYNNMNELDD